MVVATVMVHLLHDGVDINLTEALPLMEATWVATDVLETGTAQIAEKWFFQVRANVSAVEPKSLQACMTTDVLGIGIVQIAGKWFLPAKANVSAAVQRSQLV